MSNTDFGNPIDINLENKLLPSSIFQINNFDFADDVLEIDSIDSNRQLEMIDFDSDVTEDINDENINDENINYENIYLNNDTTFTNENDTTEQYFKQPELNIDANITFINLAEHLYIS